VYIHAVIQDGQGRPMKKSLGNGVDPVDIIELYGADALRYTLTAMSTETQDVRLPVKEIKLADGRTVNTSDRFELGRNFANKLWNASRFALMNLTDYQPSPLGLEDLPVEDRWILSRLSATIAQVDTDLEGYRFSEYVATVYRFFWNELCDWYLEMVKPRLQTGQTAGTARQVLAWCLDQTLRLLHPVIPFITEAIWEVLNQACPERGIEQTLPQRSALVVADWPVARNDWGNKQIEQQFELFQNTTRSIRDTLADINRVRSAQKQKPAETLNVHLVLPADQRRLLEQAQEQLKRLASIGSLTFSATDDGVPHPVSRKRIGPAEIIVPLGGLIDVAAEVVRLQAQLQQIDKQILAGQHKLENKQFISKAPPEVVQRQRDRLGELSAQQSTIERSIEELSRG